jgi:hypothetical protein
MMVSPNVGATISSATAVEARLRRSEWWTDELFIGESSLVLSFGCFPIVRPVNAAGKPILLLSDYGKLHAFDVSGDDGR